MPYRGREGNIHHDDPPHPNAPADHRRAASPLSSGHDIRPPSAAMGSVGLPAPISGGFHEEGNASMTPVSGSFVIPKSGARMELWLNVDDWGSIVVSGPGGAYVLNMEPGNDWGDGQAGERGGHLEWAHSLSFRLPPGTYHYTVSHTNIAMEHEEYNVGICDYSIAFSELPSPDRYEEEVPICNPCSCGDEEDGDADHEPSEALPGSPDDLCRGRTGPAEQEPDTLSAQLPSFPVTRRALPQKAYEEGEGNERAFLPIGMRSESLWDWRASLQHGLITITPPTGADILFNTQRGSDEALPSGASRKRDFRVQLQNDDFTPCTDDDPAFLLLVDDSGQRVRFSVETGKVTAVISASGKLTTAAERAQQVWTSYDGRGNLTACFSVTEGLMQVTAAEDGSQVLSWYAPENVTVNDDGTFSTTGEPYKTATYRRTLSPGGASTTTVHRRQKGLPEHVVKRTVEGNIVTITRGMGDDAIIRTYETNSLFDNKLERIETVRGINDAEPVSCTREVKQYTADGWLTISRTEAFNTPLARTTTYEYNEQFRVSKETRPDGGVTLYEYDAKGRLTKRTEPWAEGGTRITRKVYPASSSRFYDTRPIKVYTDYRTSGGSFLNVAVTDYTYEDTPQAERTTATTYAAGISHQQVSIEETCGEAAEYPYAAGKPKSSQDIAGVQTYHEYEATTEHNAVHKHTATTKANGELVGAQSRRMEEFIAANGTVVWEQESIWDGESWQLLATAAHEYDEQQRLIKTTRGDGRVSTKSWMCCGLLSETDEDGIRTDDAYNTAHQQTEASRCAVYDGDTCITPEIITEYVRDAMGRVLSATRRTGAMETTESTTYDALGRVISRTDILGRVTTTAYSEDGLTTTETDPAGATFITERNLDGSVAHVSGTGQRELYYSYDHHNNRMRETVKLGDNSTILSQRITDGFGQLVAEVEPGTAGYIYTRSEYNAKGQLTKQYQDTGSGSTPTAAALYEYDIFGNVTKRTLALSDTPTVDNSPIEETSYGLEVREDGVYSVVAQTRYNAAGSALTRTRKQLLSEEDATLASQVIVLDERGQQSVNREERGTNSRRTTYSTVPTSDITTETVSVDGFIIRRKDEAGVTTRTSRRYIADGMILTQTDGRGNATTTVADKAGRTISITDAAGNTSATTYDAHHDRPACITDALGNTTCFRYDRRGRKVSEWGSGIQPACFAYDDADRLTTLTTFRVGMEIISDDPGERTDGDVTTWSYHDATGLETCKTYADGSSTVKTYDAYNRLREETLARGLTRTHRYEHARGLLLGTTCSDGSTARRYTYNHLGQLTRVSDDAGTRTIRYNPYGEPETDSLSVRDETHLITETRDDCGRSTGYTYSRNGAVQQSVVTSYGTDGRISGIGFLHNGEEQTFAYGYQPGSHLLRSLTMPNGISLTQTWEAQRDLLTGMSYRHGNAPVARRSYTYDALGRPTARDTVRQDSEHNDTFIYNNRSELINAVVSSTTHAYDYDNIGNRRMAIEGASYSLYESNELNQYTDIREGHGSSEPTTFIPTFDADGNQTSVKTATGVWEIVYNAENRPITFTSEDGATIVECTYDSMGRRATRKVTRNGKVTQHRRYLYRGYLQIAACDLTAEEAPTLWHILWDPTQALATRPLSIRKGDSWYTYGWDLTKNICELHTSIGTLATAYTYTPYGEVSSDGDIEQPFQWSSEFHDAELGLVYYNFRYYSPSDGRWMGRDYSEFDCNNLYAYTKNHSSYAVDSFGRASREIWTGMAKEPSLCTNHTNSSSSAKVDCSTWKCGGSVRRYNASTQCCEYRTTTQKEDYTPSHDGCGSGDLESYVPDRSFLPACILHDICYGTCGTSQSTCDNQFRQNLYTICERLEQEWWSSNRYEFIGDLVHGSGLYLASCKRLADIYYLAVNKFGEGAFEAAQKEACDWKACTKN